MPASVRFVPADCPECRSPVEIAYSEYRHSGHPLFVPLLILGVAGGFALMTVSLWTIVALLGDRLDEVGFKACVVTYLVIWMATLPVIGVPLWLGWRFLERLPRRIAYECRACQWSGLVRAYEAPVTPPPREEIVESDGTPMKARRERQQRRVERERRQGDAPEAPPNSDFDFSGP